MGRIKSNFGTTQPVPFPWVLGSSCPIPQHLSCHVSLLSIKSFLQTPSLMATHSIHIPFFPIPPGFLSHFQLSPSFFIPHSFFLPFPLHFSSFLPLHPSPLSNLSPSLLLPHTSLILLSSPTLHSLSSLPMCTHLPL